MNVLFKYLKNYKIESVLALIFKFTEVVFELVTPLVTAKIIDVGIKNSDTAFIYKMGALLVSFGIVGLAAAVTAQFFAAKAAVSFAADMRKDLFSHINTLSHAEIDRLGSSTLVTRLTVDVNAVQNGVNMFLRLFTRAPFIVIGSIVMSLSISVKLTMIFIVFTPLLALVIYLVSVKTVPMYGEVQKKLDEAAQMTGESISGVRVIRAFSRQNDEEKDFRRSTNEYRSIQLAAGKLSALTSPATYALVNIAIILIIWLGGINVDTGSVTQGEIIALINYMNQILLSLIRLAELIMALTKAAASMNRICAAFDKKTSVSDSAAAAVAATPGSPAVEFKNVTFNYVNSERAALENISFSINCGETVGIIGDTGCGKTTLVSLIPRFYDVSSGEVLVNGVNVKNYPIKQLRSMIGMAPQKSVLFKDTVRNNILWRKKNASDAEIISALKTAQAYDFVMERSEGLDYRLLEDGKNLSGGQRQRLNIARAVVGKPEIIILDDSASALDLATDAALRKSLSEDLCDSTVFIVSQRVSSVRNADKIIVLNDGRTAGAGTHDELYNSCPVYREICMSQLTAEEAQKE